MSELFVLKNFLGLESAEKIGEGGVADVLCCTVADNGRENAFAHVDRQNIAIKVTRDQDDIKFLHFEYKILQMLQSQLAPKRVIAPKAYFYENIEGREIVGMELLGKPLFSIFVHDLRSKFSLKTIFMILDQCFQLLYYCHKNNVFHLDIKDQNIVVGIGKKKDKLFLVDFGQSVCFDLLDNFEYASSTNIPFLSESYGLEGAQIEQTKKLCRDKDLVDVLKMALFFLDPEEFSSQDIDLGSNSVTMTAASMRHIQETLSKYLPELWDIFSYIVSSGPMVPLNYTKMRGILRRGALKRNIVYDGIFDWMS